MTTDHLTTADLRGRKVLDRAGNTLGNVEDLTIDPTGLRVTGFIVKMTREAADRLNVSAPLMGSARIEVGSDRLSSIGDNVLLNIDQREMAGMLYDSSERPS